MKKVGWGDIFIIAIYCRRSQGLLHKNLCKLVTERRYVKVKMLNLLNQNSVLSILLGIVKGCPNSRVFFSPIRYRLSFLINTQMVMILDSTNEEVSRPFLWNNKTQR